MRKQTGFSFRQYRYSAVDPTAARVVVDEGIRQEYLLQGWEVFHVDVTKVDVNDVYVNIAFVKYEDEVSAKSATK